MTITLRMALTHLRDLPVAIHPDTHTPVYAQLAGQIDCMVISDQLRAGDLLPQIRVLAAQLRINPNTVARAYNELEQAGVIRKRQGSGCFVTGRRSARRSADRWRQLRPRMEQLVSEAAAAGIALTDVIAELQRLGNGPALTKPVPITPKATRPPASERFETANAPADLWSASAFVD